MIIDWESKKTEIFLNPRVGDGDRLKITKSLEEISDFPAHIWIATSGTTNAMKFVALSKEALLSSAEAVNKRIDSGKNDIWLHPLPDFHVGGIGIWARSYLSKAKVIKYTGKWDAKKFLALAKKSKAAITSLVPSQLYDLAKMNLTSPINLRAVFVGGGALSDELYDRAVNLSWKILPTYGLTECSSQVATAFAHDKNLYPLDHIRLKIDREKNICVKSKALFSSYAYFENGKIRLDDPKKNGWFKTEDKGEMKNGVLQVFGRAKNYIKIGGEGVNLQLLRNIWEGICLKGGIDSKTALIAAKDERLGYVIHLLVQENCTKLQNHIEQYNEVVLPYAKIREITLVEKIPGNAMGKAML